MRYLDTYYIVTELDKDFAINEGAILEPGDVITSVADRPVRGTLLDLKRTLNSGGRKPMRIEVTKIRCAGGNLFEPVVRILMNRGFANILNTVCTRAGMRSVNYIIL